MQTNNRSVQYPHRYRMDATGQPNVYDLVAIPGTVYDSGTPLTADNLAPIPEVQDTGKTCEDVSI